MSVQLPTITRHDRWRTLARIIVHCADTADGQSVSVEEIDRWHAERGFQRSWSWRNSFNSHLNSCGYHFVIDVDGSVHTARHIDEIGAHCVGSNVDSIGICMIGRTRFTAAQWQSLAALVKQLCTMVHGLDILGHGERNPNKFCPGFDVRMWAAQKFEPSAANLLETA